MATKRTTASSREQIAIGKRLAKARQPFGIGMAAGVMGVKKSVVMAWESGRAPIPANMAWIIAKGVANTTVGHLLRGEYHYSADDVRLPSPYPELGDDLTGFAARVKEARENLGIELTDVARALDNLPVSMQNWRLWEAGQDEPSPEEARYLAWCLEVDLAWLYSGQPTGKPAPIARKTRLETEFELGHHIGLGPLKEAREAAGISLQDAVRFLGEQVTVANLRKAENAPPGSRHVKIIDRLPALAILYGVSLEYLALSHSDDYAVLRRRVERFKRRLGLTNPPGKTKTAAA